MQFEQDHRQNQPQTTNAGVKKTKPVWILPVCLVLLFAAIGGTLLFQHIYRSVMGSDDCIIASDYSRITYQGSIYVPLDTGRYQYLIGERLVSEAKVEDSYFSTKLMFSDSVYAIEGCPDAALIHLQTEYDLLSTHCYCKEDLLDTYRTLLDSLEPSESYALILSENWEQIPYKISVDLEHGLQTAAIVSEQTCSVTRAGSNEFFEIIKYGEDGIFYRKWGTVLLKKGAYYWFPVSLIPEGRDREYYEDLHPYVIEHGKDELDQLVSKMFQ